MLTTQKAKLTTSRRPAREEAGGGEPQDSLRGKVRTALTVQCRVGAGGVLPDLLTKDAGSEE